DPQALEFDAITVADPGGRAVPVLKPGEKLKRVVVSIRRVETDGGEQRGEVGFAGLGGVAPIAAAEEQVGGEPPARPMDSPEIAVRVANHQDAHPFPPGEGDRLAVRQTSWPLRPAVEASAEERVGADAPGNSI